MTVKEKAIAYDKALEIARQYWNDRAMPIGTNFKLERMFPELKESEGEGIRKEIISAINIYCSEYHRGTKVRNDMLAWLEKQVEQKLVVIIPKFRVGDEIKTSNEESLTITKIDENGYWSEDLFICGFDEECIWDLVGQKHADKIEPKFKVGDWIIYKDDIWKICNISLGAYYELLKVDGEVIIRHFEGVDKTAHLWTVKDAKDGDVLVLNNEIFIYAHRKQMYPIAVAQCFVDSAGGFHLDGEFGYVEHGGTISPATKEQSDILMKAIADARYTFDPEKKELKKVEQKHTPKHKVGDTIYYNSFGEVKSMIVANVVTDSTDNPMYEDENGNAVFEKDLIEQNLAKWSKEDENRFKNLIELVEQSNEGKGTKEGFIKFINRLKSIRPHNTWKPSAWSKEDEGYFNSIAHALSVLLVDPYYDEIKLEHTGWFNSIKNRYTWKPSEEQIETLKCACGGNYVNLGILESLYNDLKKL